MSEETYRFTHELARGRHVDIYYAPAQQHDRWIQHTDRGPHFTVSLERFDEITETAPQGLSKSTFRIVRDYGRFVDLEWT